MTQSGKKGVRRQRCCSVRTLRFIYQCQQSISQSFYIVVLLHDIYISNVGTFSPESNIIPPTTFCCTFKTLVVCGDWKIK